MSHFFMRPGQEFKTFKVLRPQSIINDRGRTKKNQYDEIGSIKGILAQARPDERERWHQMGHSVSHKIIQRHYGYNGDEDLKIVPRDVFEYQGQWFYNQNDPYDPGGLGHWTIYYCEERSDLT